MAKKYKINEIFYSIQGEEDGLVALLFSFVSRDAT